MKKLLKLSICIMSIILILSNCIFASVASSATIAFSSNTVAVGDTVSVTVRLNPNVPMYTVNFSLSYDANILKYNSGASAGGAGVLQMLEVTSGEKSIAYTINFTAIKSGTSNISVTNCSYEKLGNEGAETVNFGGASASLTVKDPALSSNANLSSLKISNATLSPKFSQSKTSYTASVLYETTKLNVTATAADKGAKVVSVEGNSNLKVGKNNVVVTVQAANGTTKKYTIIVTRLAQGEKLSTDQPTEELPPEEVTDTAKLETIIAGTTYIIATEIPENKLFKGFSASTATYNETEVAVAVDQNENYKIYYLKAADSEELLPYIYNTELEVFEKLKYLSFGDNIYIFEKFPTDFAIPENYYTTNFKISDYSVDCLANNDDKLADMYYVYCYSNGNYSVYRYDGAENTIQRYPELKLEKVSDVIVKDNLLSRFASLSLNSKVIVIGILIAVLGALALIVILIISIIRKFKNSSNDILLDDYEDFDEIYEEEPEEVKSEE